MPASLSEKQCQISKIQFCDVTKVEELSFHGTERQRHPIHCYILKHSSYKYENKKVTKILS